MSPSLSVSMFLQNKHTFTHGVAFLAKGQTLLKEVFFFPFPDFCISLWTIRLEIKVLVSLGSLGDSQAWFTRAANHAANFAATVSKSRTLQETSWANWAAGLRRSLRQPAAALPRVLPPFHPSTRHELGRPRASVWQKTLPISFTHITEKA